MHQLVPAVTELVVAELMYLQWVDAKEPIYIYINSTGTTRDDGETVRFALAIFISSSFLFWFFRYWIKDLFSLLLFFNLLDYYLENKKLIRLGWRRRGSLYMMLWCSWKTRLALFSQIIIFFHGYMNSPNSSVTSSFRFIEFVGYE